MVVPCNCTLQLHSHWNRTSQANDHYFTCHDLCIDVEPELLFALLTSPDADHMLNFLTEQMRMKARLKCFGHNSADALVKELELLYCQVIIGWKAKILTQE